MRVLLDTSVLVAAMTENHPAHERALPWLQRIRSGTDSGVVSAHSIAEMYAVMTALPVRPRISPSVVRQLIEQNVLENCEVVSLSEKDYADLIVHLASTGITGGMTYDALILHAATKVEVDRIITLNEKHFRKAHPTITDKLTAP